MTTSTKSAEARVEKSLNLIATLYFEYSASTNGQVICRTIVAASASSYLQTPAVTPVNILMRPHKKGGKDKEANKQGCKKFPRESETRPCSLGQ